MAKAPDVGRLRLAAQRLIGEPCADATRVVRWMTCLQAQDLPGVVVSVALRSQSRRRDEVEAALATGAIVRSWPMRGTLHFVPAEDLGWMLELTRARSFSGSARRRADLGIADADIARAVELSREALRGGRQLTRAELFSVWEAHGVTTAGQRGYHLLWNVAQAGAVCFGPLSGREQLIVDLDDWVAAPRRLDPEEALTEWALRFFRSHGPATLKDFARWTGLPVSVARAAAQAVRTQLAALDVAGVEHLMDPETPDRLAACGSSSREVLLLPGFDEFVLGYGDRSAVLDAEHATAIVPGGNGIFRPTVVGGGRLLGTWKHVGRGARRTLEATPFTTFPAVVTKALPRVYDALP